MEVDPTSLGWSASWSRLSRVTTHGLGFDSEEGEIRVRWETERWQLSTPDAPIDSRTRRVLVATIHPRGDQRILKCIQSLLSHGCSVHIVWLGDELGHRVFDEWLEETVVSSAGSTFVRMRRTVEVLRHALRARAHVLYIHDFYMLPHAAFWRVRSAGGSVVFDSHEHYPELYGAKFPKVLRPFGRRLLRILARVLQSTVDGFSLVSDEMVPEAERGKRPVIVTPNFPSTSLSPASSTPAEGARLRKVIHSGSLSPAYGAALLLEAAHLVDRQALDVEIVAIERFGNEANRKWFYEQIERSGMPESLTMISPRPAHEMQSLLQEYGVGLSLIQPTGQNPLAIPTKIYEYASTGLAVVATDLPAQGRFVRESPGVTGALFAPDSADGLVTRLREIMASPNETAAELRTSTEVALASFSWEASCHPQFAMFAELGPRL